MAKFAISKEGVASLNQLANNLLTNTNNIVESNQRLEQVIHSLYDELGIFSDEIIGIILRNRQALNANREGIICLVQNVKRRAEDIYGELVRCGLVEEQDDSKMRMRFISSFSKKNTRSGVLEGHYKDINTIPEKEHSLIERYVTNGNDINTGIREGNETEDIVAIRQLIGNHMITKDMILYRRGSREDFNDKNLLNCSLEELVGKKITFWGFMSTTPNKELAKTSNSNPFEIEFLVPEGMEALDLSNLPYNEVIFNDGISYIIEDARIVGQNTEHIVARIIGYDE